MLSYQIHLSKNILTTINIIKCYSGLLLCLLVKGIQILYNTNLTSSFLTQLPKMKRTVFPSSSSGQNELLLISIILLVR